MVRGSIGGDRESHYLKKGFLAILENYEAIKPAFNVESLSARERNAI